VFRNLLRAAFAVCGARFPARRQGFPRSVPKLGRARSEKKSATCPAAGTSQIGRTLTLCPRSGTDGLAPSPQLGGRWRLQGFPCSSRRTPCSYSQGIGRYSRGKAREFRLSFQQESQIAEKFPVFSLSIRDMASETSSLQTGSTAIQSASPGFVELERGMAAQNPAVARGFGRGRWRSRTGDCAFGARKTPQSVFVSVARLAGSDSLPIRPLRVRITPKCAKSQPNKNIHNFRCLGEC
jgi:hypothetical protein